MAEILVDRAVRSIAAVFIQMEEVIGDAHSFKILEDDEAGFNRYTRIIQDTDGLTRMIRKLEPASLARMHRDCRSLADKFSLPSRRGFVQDENIVLIGINADVGNIFRKSIGRAILNRDGTISLLDSDGIRVGILGVINFRYFYEHNSHWDYNIIGVQMEMRYIDQGSTYTDFNFVQTVREIENGERKEPKNDPLSTAPPFYNGPDFTINNAPGASFDDSPSRPVWSNSVVEWEAETSLVGKNWQGRYEILATLSWGFRYNAEIERRGMNGVLISPRFEEIPTQFQQTTVDELNNR